MIPITEGTQVERYQKSVAEMTVPEPFQECEFDPRWIQSQKWKVVPVEDGDHFSREDIRIIVAALRNSGYTACVAVATEPVGSLASVYSLSLSEEDFLDFNRACGLLRYLLTDDERSWAISCNEWYNLFAGKQELIEAMLGKSVEEAREEYLQFASKLSKRSDEPLLRVAERYANF